MTPRPRRWRRVRRLFLFLAAVWLGTVVVMKWLENRLVYPGNTAAESWVPCPVADCEDVWTATPDGTKIHGWYFPSTPGADVVLFAHGNGGNLSHRSRTAIELRKVLGAAVLLFDYPGYGKSAGSPSEAGCYAAGDAMIAWLANEKHVPKAKLILFGESLGGGVATELAVRHEHKALVLTKTFTSLPAAAKSLFPFLPTHTLMSNRFDSLAKLPRVRTPVFVAHGTADRTVPFELGEALFAVANEPKAFHRMEGQEHNAWFTSDFYAALKAFLEKHAP